MVRRALVVALLSIPCLAAAQQQVLDAFAVPNGGDEHTAAKSAGTLRRFTPGTPQELEEVLGIAERHDLDVWQIRADRPSVDIYTPNELPDALKGFPHSLSRVSVPSLPSPLSAGNWDLSSLANTTFHDEWHPQDEVDAFILNLAVLHPERVTVLELGHTAEGREMLGLKVSSGAAVKKGAAKPKLGFVLMGPQHSREWVATSTALYFAHALLADASEPGSLAGLLDTYDFHIIPSPNPDGYVYTWETDRFWYKNRQIVGPGAQCIGIDMNRNWGYKWKSHSDSPLLQSSSKKKDKEPADPCSHWYPGHRAFEAAEVTNVANYITKINGVGKGAGKGGIAAFVDLRSYGQMLAAPYSYKCDKLPKDGEDQMEALHGAAQAGRSVHGMGFTAGRLCELLYTAPGNMIDYIYNTASIKYTYAAFLRDTGTYGFALPASWIRPVGEETSEIVSYIARFVAKPHGYEM
uniref:Inactive metallocarboxypeptidase ECM14 n=1 Tax=Mycena chlorophos TaxID=658473 RepID=A0ABQ0LBR9_MYCCL|nr:zinc carboxypeptidase [Mycena chlorophos]